MSTTISVMNAKGGVGKSTLVLALAETLSAYQGKRVLVIDSDAQASVSSMFMTIPHLHQLQTEQLTLVDYLIGGTLSDQDFDWRSYVVDDVSDVDDARSVHLIPSDMQLTLFEREVSKESLHSRLRMVVARLLDDIVDEYDYVLIDCSPGLSVLTECWLRESNYHVSPTKADYVSVCGLEVFRRFQSLNPEMGFAENLGVIVNMRDNSSKSEVDYHAWLRSNSENRCFEQAVPRVAALQDAARYVPEQRSYFAKYPGHVGEALRCLAKEFVERVEDANDAASRSDHSAEHFSTAGAA